MHNNLGEYPGVIMTIVLRRQISYHLLQVRQTLPLTNFDEDGFIIALKAGEVKGGDWSQYIENGPCFFPIVGPQPYFLILCSDPALIVPLTIISDISAICSVCDCCLALALPPS